MAKGTSKRSERESAGAGPPEGRRSVCPVACTLDVIGDRWSLLVIRDMFSGKTRYKEFLASPERISTNILAERLRRLTAAGLVEATASGEREGAASYRLTAAGLALRPVLEAARDWGLAFVPETEARVRV